MTALTVTELLERLADVDDRGLRFEETELSWREHVAQSRRRAALLRDLLDGPAPKHIGILMDNVPEFSLLLGAAAFSGSVVVGLNTTRRGAALARDIALADCRVVFTEAAHASLLDGVDLGDVRVIDVDSPEWTAMLAPFADTVVETAAHSPDDLFMLIFTSGTSGDPKAVRCTHRKFTDPATMLATRFGLGPDDTVYVSMPLFHSNAMIAGWAIGLAARGSIALRRRFSASGFLPDVRRYGVTFANYVGKPLSYVVATPEQPDDHDNPLRIVYGNEASAADVAEFTRRFGARVVDGFGSTEGGIAIASAPDAPAGALGRLPEGIEILDPETGRRCLPAVFDANGRITNADTATGELVNVRGAGLFDGYYNNPEADAERLRDGRYHSGDLAYRDENGFVYFAGRSSGWLRVDGENLGAAPIERILMRYEGFAQVAVYGVPDRNVGDRVMAAVIPAAGSDFDPVAFARFLDAQTDLGPKQMPGLIRVCSEFPRTATFKVLTRSLAAERWSCSDPVWLRERGDSEFRLLSDELVHLLEPASVGTPAR
ncbi:long-chain-fatty-acid--CoA ligase [Rhodococcus rhodochrous]|uniref:long-chain-fatty-acid--CoA ligase n=1 Tax=Rhodococcus rhodochrous TaxID=1829 RepID=UPI001E3AA0B3|nr:long-chain-fatty-acid--CoA ligase [Rhodococcus rhodochrous]MCD2098104.1 long-chain-fatty-acid--CoA ligase [Rhodococcus rhodochrous]MCD2122230.1 long-chain-fatty-acid--CoA ligase [Rhodococcus rhodochrous]MCQ4133829.1 long-chain-fatty-acid--CoA ligase [Rhodococcus rhodochrous]MDJ0019094.1 long-chain-fatty-acid--CoA ligase [Rhodococcus rhodochrous]